MRRLVNARAVVRSQLVANLNRIRIWLSIGGQSSPSDGMQKQDSVNNDAQVNDPPIVSTIRTDWMEKIQSRPS